MRINGDKTLTEREKLDTLIILLTTYKNPSMTHFGGFNDIFQEWDITSYENLDDLPLCGISSWKSKRNAYYQMMKL